MARMNTELLSQKELFEAIKRSLPANVSLVHEISEILGLSYDSAYRRIRVEKEISMEELRKLSLHYGISVDTLFNLESDNIVFNSRILGENVSFMNWLKTILGYLKKIQVAHTKEIIYSAKDIPIFHYFEFPEIFAFKVYFWHKALIPTHEYEGKFIKLDVEENLMEIGREIAMIYSKIPASELWNEETFNSIIRQIEFCYVSGYFASEEDAFKLCDALEKMIHHMQAQAETGYRFLYGTNPDGIEGSFKLYCNEVLLGDNTIFVQTDGNPTTFFTFNVINLLITTNTRFCLHTEKSLRILMKESVLISASASKDRNRFFISIHEKINNLRKKLNR
jgi:hypothetical protein